MSPSTLGEWISGRTPPVPAAFAEQVTPERADAEGTSESLLRETRVALTRALACESGDRQGAFALLAADAFATWAAEAALETADPEGELLRLVHALMQVEGQGG